MRFGATAFALRRNKHTAESFWFATSPSRRALPASGRQCGRQCGRQLSANLTTLESFALRESFSESRQLESEINKKDNKARPAKQLEQEGII